MKSKRKMHKQMILDRLLKGHTIDHSYANDVFGCSRISARIYDLRKAGYNIKTLDAVDGGYAQYKLVR